MMRPSHSVAVGPFSNFKLHFLEVLFLEFLLSSAFWHFDEEIPEYSCRKHHAQLPRVNGGTTIMGSGSISFQNIYVMYEGIQCNLNTGIN